MTDLRPLAYDMCRCYVESRRGLIDDKTLNLILGWIRSRDINRLSTADAVISHAYHDERLCRFTRQVSAFFKKNPAFADPAKCKLAAETSFFEAEDDCAYTNAKLDFYSEHRWAIPSSFDRMIRKAESIVSDTLGDPADLIEKLPYLVKVTAGASASRSRRNSLPYLKVRTRKLPATPGAIPYLKALAKHYGFKRITFERTYRNRVETVPKNWKTDRTIACEPEGNLFLQLAVDSFIKKSLKRKLRIDLSDQSRNQRLAKEGSLSGRFSTIDLSAASDTVSLNAVHWLFPRKWAKLLLDFRSPQGEGFGRQFTYQKLSSMGNGNTFAVETLVFAALCKACGSKEFSVYGDDIIIETELYDDLLALLQFFGFQVNESKSFHEGPFRESCGADWFDGREVTPVYLRAASSMKVEFCHIVNSMASLLLKEDALSEFLIRLVTDKNLPLIPWNSSSISGVWISAHHAYERRLIQSRDKRKVYDGIPKVLALTPKAKVKVVRDSRTYFLWHLQASKRSKGESFVLPRNLDSLYLRTVGRDSATQCIVSSEVSTFSHRYVRSWVGWFPPAEVAPDHLYWWSDLVTRRKADY